MKVSGVSAPRPRFSSGFYLVPGEGRMHAPLASPKGLHMGCPHPTLETPQKPLPCSRVGPQLVGGVVERVMDGAVGDMGSKP